jgi:hypothetical protein
MHSMFRKSRRPQTGVSLVSLMVGLALSLLCVVVAMHTYRVTVLNSRHASVVARGQNISAALTLQIPKLLPQAGWGLNVAEETPGGRLNTDLVLLSSATFQAGRLSGTTRSIGSASLTGNALIWATAIEGSVQCRALVTTAARGLELLGPKACANAAAATGIDWDSPVTLAPAEAASSLGFSVRTTACWPFGGRHARESVEFSFHGAFEDVPPTCIPNITG